MINVSLYILFVPLIAFGIVVFFGKILPRNGDWVSLFAIWSGLALSLYLFVSLVLGNYDPAFSQGLQFNWLAWGDYHLTIGIKLDNVSIVMLVVVTLVSSLVHLYSVGYMKGDPKYGRFFAYLSIFSFSMIGLVLADNLLIIYAFWELVGLSSYLLIGFWHEKDTAANASKKAFITNRIGDAGMLAGILIVFASLGTLNLTEVGTGIAAGHLSGNMLTIAGVCLFCGAIGKSAQFPLHVWLPDAMEGPTPVSALIHAATMVAAGVYLVVRLFVFLTPDASLVIAYVGGFTALFAATIAVAQNDIKRVLAYSTVSQLGYMIMALGVGAYTAGFFHLVTHAMFKACLFLGSGSVIHAMHGALHSVHSDSDPQDMRNMGGLKKYLPVTYWTFLIATVALSGVPLTSGFLSKDAILGGSLAFAMQHPAHWLLPLFGFLAALLTAFYMFRLVFLTFFGKFRVGPKAEKSLHESPKVMTVPLITLSALCFFGIYTLPAFNPTTPTGGWFSNLMPTPARVWEGVVMMDDHQEKIASHGVQDSHQSSVSEHSEDHDVHHTAHIWAMIISLLVAGGGIWLATMGYLWKRFDPAAWQRRLGVVYQGMYHKWWSDEINQLVIINGSTRLANIISWFDAFIVDGVVNAAAFLIRQLGTIHGWFDLYVVDGLVNLSAWIVGLFGRLVQNFQGGMIQRYIFIMILTVGLFIIIKIF